MAVVGDGVADLCVRDVLDVGDQKSGFARLEFLDIHRLGRQHAQSFHFEHAIVRPQPNLLPFAQRSLKDAGKDDHAAIGIKPRIEDQSLQRICGRALRWRHALHDRFQHLGHALPGFGADQHGVAGIQTDCAFDHFLGARNVGALQIDLVDDRDNLQPVINREIGIRQRLGLDALGSIDHQQSSLARRQRARDLVREIHVAGGIDEVELIGLAVMSGVHHPNRVGLDGNSAFAFQVHRVKDLRLHLAGGQRAGQLEQAIRQRRFAVVDVGDDREIADMGDVHAGLTLDFNGQPSDL